MIVAARHENANVDAVARRAVQRFDLGRRRREVRRRDPDRAARGDGLDLQRARDAKSKRLAFDDADERRHVRRGIEMRAARRPSKKPVRSATLVAVAAPPHVVERLDHVVRGGPLDLHGGVAPTRAMLLLHAGRPFASDADAAGDADRPVDDEQLAVIARNESEPRVEARAD